MLVQFDVAAVEREYAELGQNLDDEIGAALTTCARNVAETVQETHTYTNRTGDLERLTAGQESTGRFMQGTAQALVVADTFYAGIVDAMPGYEFMQPALDESMAGLDAEIQDAADRAAARSGY